MSFSQPFATSILICNKKTLLLKKEEVTLRLRPLFVSAMLIILPSCLLLHPGAEHGPPTVLLHG